MPKTNQEYWEDKFTRNQIRDSRKRSEIERLGWKVLVIWECELKNLQMDELVRSIPT